jgi:asparagine N-glycosylation enzyme membrane subunit Stt3
MKITNLFYFYLHCIFLVLLVISIYISHKEKEKRNVIIYSISGTLIYYILISSGISFWQGDRLVLPSLPIFIFLYIFSVYIDRVRL